MLSMEKCSKCGNIISDNDIMAWKCAECGKAFKVNLSKLEKLQMLKEKPENTGKMLLKCSACGKGIDNGNEKIACKCSACGNIMIRNLGDFVCEEKNTKQNNVYTFYNSNISVQKHSRNNKYSKKYIILLSFVVLICILISAPTIEKKYIAHQAISLLKSELRQFANDLVVEDIFYNKEYNSCVIEYCVGTTEDTAVVNLGSKSVGICGIFDEISSISNDICSSDIYSVKEKQESAKRVLEYPYDPLLVYNLHMKGTIDGSWKRIK